MVRKYQRKSTYNKYGKDHILNAVKAIKIDGKQLSKVADEYGIKVSSLYYHLNRYKNYDFTTGQEIKEIKNVNQVFTKEMEFEFVEQFEDACDHCIGLGPSYVRKFAYEFAVENDLDLRESWVENEAAGEDWYVSFIKRHPIVTSMKNFNSNSIQTFFKNYQDLLDNYGFKDKNIFKLDELLFTTAKQPNRVFARRGKKDKPDIESMKQEEITTMISANSASGTAVPPMFLIPRTGFVSDMMEKAMEGSIKVTSKIGWLSKADFIEYLEHFVKNVKCGSSKPCVLIMDNHTSCLSLEAIAYAKDNGIFILILPMHTFNKLQPLKDKVFEDLKTKVNDACEKWVEYHSKKSMKIRDIINLVEKIFPNVFTSSAIKIGFELSHLYPLHNVDYNDESTEISKIVVTPDIKIESTNTTENMVVQDDDDDDDDDTSTSLIEDMIITDNKEEMKSIIENIILPDKNDVNKDTSEDMIIPDKNDERKGTLENMIIPDKNDEKGTLENINEPDKDDDDEQMVTETHPVVKEEEEDEIVVYYPTDVESSMKMPLSQIAGIVGTPLEIKKEEIDETDVEQKENIDDRRIDENEDIVDLKVKDEPIENNFTEINELDKQDKSELQVDGKVKDEPIKTNLSEINESNKQDKRKLKVNGKIKEETNEKNLTEGNDKSELDRKKRRKPKVNSKLSDYVCY